MSVRCAAFKKIHMSQKQVYAGRRDFGGKIFNWENAGPWRLRCYVSRIRYSREEKSSHKRISPGWSLPQDSLDRR